MIDYLLNYKSKKVKQFTDAELLKTFTEILNHVFNYTNRVPVDKSKTITNFITDIKELNLSINEVKEALRQGMKGTYGDVMDISNMVLYKWLKTYISNPDRIDSIKKWETQNSFTQKELTPEEVRLKDIACLKELFIQFKTGETDYIKVPRGMWYDLLSELKAEDLADYKKFLDIAKNRLIVEESRTKVSTMKEERALKQLLHLIETNDTSVERRIMHKAKEIAVNEYFELIDELKID